MREGLYESPLSTSLRDALPTLVDLVPELDKIGHADEPALFGHHLAAAVRRALESKTDSQGRIALVNAVLSAIHEPGEQLQDSTILRRLARPGIPTSTFATQRPASPLSETTLLTNARGEPQLGHELRAELSSADRVDLLCAFVKWHGIRVLEPALKQANERGTRIRVITTTYMGATELRALERLATEFDAEVRVHYEERSTRLHAKAWLFHRASGFDTAYVGSSNLSHSALIEGLEWNVRLSSVANPDALAKFQATFDSYWADPTFEHFDPTRDSDRLADALAVASGSARRSESTITLSGLDVRPYPHQSEILQALEAERIVHDRHRNLVVAATGTGKTVVAALDYRRLREQFGDLRLLFIAHRSEILEQSKWTFRNALSDGAFGESFHSGHRPRHWNHVFASVQSLSGNYRAIERDHFDVIVLDEFHHAEARTYRALLEWFTPRELLGLTATPERTDGVDVRSFFDGRTAFELRLWDALDADLLVPFHYFGISDNTALEGVAWHRGRYDVQGLSNLYTGNDARARIVLRELTAKVGDVRAMRALGFCVSVDHAKYMARVFREAGIPAESLTGDVGPEARSKLMSDLVARRINIIFCGRRHE